MTRPKPGILLQTRLSQWSKETGWLGVGIAGVGLASFVLGFIGWCFVPAPKDVGPWSSIAYDFAAALQSFAPNPDRFKEGNVVTRFAAAISMLSALSAGLLTASALLARAIERFWIANVAKGHVVLLGDTDFVKNAAVFLAPSHNLVRAIPTDTPHQSLDDDGPFQISRDADDILRQTRGLHASAILIDLPTDLQTLHLTAALHQRLPAFSLTPRLAFCYQNKLLAEPFFDQYLDTLSQTGVRDRPAMVNQADLIARKTLGQHPLFAQADQLGQSRVHAVIIGFGALGKAIMEHVFLTGTAGPLLLPKVTVFETDPNAKAAFDARRPHVSSSLEIGFETFDTRMNGFDPEHGTSRLCDIVSTTPVTAYFIALPSDELNLETALHLQRLFARRPNLSAPIFYRCRDDAGDLGGVIRVYHWPWRPEQAVPLCAMSFAREDIDEALLPDSDHDLLAQRFHSAYVAGASTGGDATQRWPMLRETYRRSNIRAAWHVAAKLYTLGVSVETLRTAPLGSLPQLKPAENALIAEIKPDSDAVLNLAKIEHTRWMIDRKLDGWHHGPVRDNANLIHPLLVDWDILVKDSSEVEKDRRIVLESLRSVLADDGHSKN
jgi:hypothetical protein